MNTNKYYLTFKYDGDIIMNIECVDFWWESDTFVVMPTPSSKSFYNRKRMSGLEIKTLWVIIELCHVANIYKSLTPTMK
jgi:hypothetical protein